MLGQFDPLSNQLEEMDEMNVNLKSFILGVDYN